MFKYMYSCNCALKLQYVATANLRVVNTKEDVDLRFILSSNIECCRKQIRDLLVSHDIFDLGRIMTCQKRISINDVDIIDESLVIIFSVDGDPLNTSDLNTIKSSFDEIMRGEWGDKISNTEFDYILYETASDDSTVKCHLSMVTYYNDTEASLFNIGKWDSMCSASWDDDELVSRGKLICKFVSRANSPESIDFVLSEGGMVLVNKEDNSVLEFSRNNMAYSYTLKDLNEEFKLQKPDKCVYSSPLSTYDYGPYVMKRSDKVVKVIDLTMI